LREDGCFDVGDFSQGAAVGDGGVVGFQAEEDGDFERDEGGGDVGFGVFGEDVRVGEEEHVEVGQGSRG